MAEGPTPEDAAMDLEALLTFYTIEGASKAPQLAAVIVGLARRCIHAERQLTAARSRAEELQRRLDAVAEAIAGQRM